MNEKEKVGNFLCRTEAEPLGVVILRSNPVAPDPRVEKIARSLARAGYRVTVVGWDRLAGFAKTETRGYAEVVRLHIRARFVTGLKNLPHLLRWQKGLCQWLFKHRCEYRIVHACDFDTVLPALFAKVLFGKLVVYDIFDFYADMLRITPKWIKSIIRRVDLWVMRHADAVIIADEGRQEQIAGARPKYSEVIYNSPGSIECECVDSIARRSSDLRIAYVGVLQIERGLLELLEVMKRRSEWELDLAGFGGDERIIVNAAVGLRNVRFHGRIPYETALKLSAEADVLVATYDPAIPNHRYSSPNKLFEAMMLGKPIIVARGTGVDRLVERFELGKVVNYGNAVELEEALGEVAVWSEERRREFAQRARTIFSERYSWFLMEQRLLRLYTLVTQNIRRAGCAENR